MARETSTGGRTATTGVIPGAYALSVGNPNTPLPEGWEWTRLTDVARLESGHTPSRSHPEYWGGTVPWIGIRDATGNHGQTIYDTEQKTNNLGIANSSARILPVDTVCLSRTASVGYVVMMGVPMATSQDFVNWVCSDQLNPHFLKYILLLEYPSFKMFSMGTTHQTIYFPEVKAFHIAMPSRRVQDQIVDILGALDEQIDLNRRMNKALEAAAQATFKDWFVDFGPVRRKMTGATDPVVIMGGITPNPSRAAKLADIFPADFADDELPLTWSEGTLARLALINSESWRASNHPVEVEYVDLSNTKWGAIESTARLAWEAAPSRARRIARKGDSIIGTVRPGNGSYAYVGRDGYTVSTGFAVLRPKRGIYSDTIYVAATAAGNIARLANLADGHGGAYPAINPDVVAATPFPVVPDALLEAFSTFVSPLRAKIEQGKVENISLSEARDYLLPRLFSGAVRINNAEHLLEQVE